MRTTGPRKRSPSAQARPDVFSNVASGFAYAARRPTISPAPRQLKSKSRALTRLLRVLGGRHHYATLEKFKLKPNTVQISLTASLKDLTRDGV
jgi:hypothetical protein